MDHRQLRTRSAAAGFTAVVLVTVLSACSQSSGANSATATSGSPKAASQEVAIARAITAKFEKEPSVIAQTTPLPSAPPAGKTLVFLQCEIAGCAKVSAGLQAAMAAVKWNYKTVNYQSADPATLTSAFKQALALNPTAVVTMNIPPEAGWASEIPAYKAAKVPIISAYLASKPSDPTIIANVGGATALAEDAKAVANWFIADSQGHGKALIERIDAVPLIKSYSDALVQLIKQGCPACDVSTVVQNTLAQAGSGGIVPSVVSALQRDSSLHYVLPAPLEFFDSYPSAAKVAGVSAKVAGTAPSLQGMTSLKNNQFQAVSVHPQVEVGWVIADVALRYAMHLPIPAEDTGALPVRLLTPAMTFPTDRIEEYPTDYEAQFKKLWHVG